MYQVLYRKWRPQVFADVFGQDHITRTLKNQAAAGRLAHAYIFSGTRGTGKTTCARILAKAANCLNLNDGDPCNACEACKSINEGAAIDIIEIDGATYNGVDDIRDLRDEAVYSPSELKKRVYIIDEVHMLTLNAFNAFLKILEEPPGHVMFILATTEPNKVPATILSRCQRFDFGRIDRGLIAKELLKISAAEGFNLDERGATLIAEISDGSMRNALSLLEQAAATGAQALTSDAVSQALGLLSAVPLLSLARDIAAGSTSAALSLFSQKYECGIDPSAFINQLVCLFRDLLICKTGVPCDYLGSGYTAKDLSALVGLFPYDRLIYSINTLRECARNMSKSPTKRIDAELCLVLLCKPAVSGTDSALASRVAELERKLAAGVPVIEKQTPPPPAADKPKPVEKPTPPEKPKPPEKPTPPAERPTPPAEKPSEDSPRPFDRRDELISLLRERMDYCDLSQVKLCEMTLDGSTLYLCSNSPTTLKIVGGREVLNALSAAASELCGKAMRAVAGPPPSAPAPAQDDAINGLLHFAEKNPDIATIK